MARQKKNKKTTTSLSHQYEQCVTIFNLSLANILHP